MAYHGEILFNINNNFHNTIFKKEKKQGTNGDVFMNNPCRREREELSSTLPPLPFDALYKCDSKAMPKTAILAVFKIHLRNVHKVKRM